MTQRQRMNFILKNILLFSLSLNLYALEIIYDTRAPYVIENKDSISGLVATPLIEALNNADIKYTLKKEPSKRHLLQIKANKKGLCVVGWFKNPKREKFGLYTKPLYQDEPMGILANASSGIKNGIEVNKLFDTTDISILVKSSYSYGKFIDKKLKTSKLKINVTATTNNKMISMIAKRRADFMFISFEEVKVLLKNHKYKKRVRFIKVSDMPQGNKRYLFCSKKATPIFIEKVNKFIK